MAETKRRGHGEGSVFHDERRDRWVAMIDLGRNEQGRRQRVWRSARTKTEAAAILRDLQKTAERGDDPRGIRRTVQNAVDDFTTHGLAPNLAAGTRYKTKHYADLLAASLGEIRLRDLTVRQIEAWLANLGKLGRSRDTIVTARRAAVHVLNHAVRIGWLPPDRNVARLAHLPRETGPGRETSALDEKAVAALLGAAKGQWWTALLRLVAVLGCRIGEAAALTWDDMDLDGGVVTIARTVRCNPDGTLTVAPPKSGSGRRLAIPTELADELRSHRLALGEHFLAAGQPLPDLVFPTRVGTLADPNDLRRWLRRIAKAGMIDGVSGFHVLRHSLASALAADGTLPVHVAAQLGHARVGTTLDVYTHSLSPVADAALSRGARLLSGA